MVEAGESRHVGGSKHDKAGDYDASKQKQKNKMELWWWNNNDGNDKETSGETSMRQMKYVNASCEHTSMQRKKEGKKNTSLCCGRKKELKKKKEKKQLRQYKTINNLNNNKKKQLAFKNSFQARELLAMWEGKKGETSFLKLRGKSDVV